MASTGLSGSGKSKPRKFVEVYDEHVRRVYGFFAYRLASREEVEDLTQQTFERALRHWARFDPNRARSLTWLLAIARNLLIDHYRRDGSVRNQPLDDVDLPSEDAPPERGLGISPELSSALDELSDRDRELIALRYGADLTGPEIAEITGLSLANVQQILSRSRRRLRELLETESG